MSKSKTNGDSKDTEITLLNRDDFCGENSNEKKLFLVQLPPELTKLKDLKFDYDDLKNDSIITINENQYIVNIIKTKVDFSCLIANDAEQSEFTAVNSFKSIIQFKRHIEVAPIQKPIKQEHRQVAEPVYVEKYLKLKKKQAKRNKHESASTATTILEDQHSTELSIKRESSTDGGGGEPPVKRKKNKK